MRYLTLLLVLSVITFGTIAPLTVGAQQRGETLAWAPIPSTMPGWTVSHR
jgi:hypothetical protein